MDSNIEIVEHDILNGSQAEDVYPDFSQVRIEVHGADDAEKILGDLGVCSEDQKHETGCLYCPADTESEILEIPEDYIEKDPIDCMEKFPEDCIEKFPEDCIAKVSEDYPEKLTEEYIVPEDPAEIEVFPQNDFEYGFVSIKEEIDQFEGTDYTDFNEVSTEPYNNDLPPEDIYHFKNKIILGSKPCPSSSEVRLQENIYIIGEPSQNSDDYQNDLKKENLTAVVLLDDWGYHLEHSTSFCKECGILFSTLNALDAHNMTAHSFLVAVSKNVAVKSTAKPVFARKSTGTVTVNSNKNIARKSTGSNNVMISKLCNHCNMVFTDHTALIKHLYELLPLKQFQCEQCDTVFNTQNDLLNHNIIHVKIEKPGIKKEKITKVQTDFKKKLLYEEDLKKKRLLSPKKEVKTIPMSVLFQCTKCNTHFLTAFAGLQHGINCSPEIKGRKTITCKTCKRKLRELDADTHKKQHELCAKFKVFKLTSNLFERTLCKCPKCGVHFNDLTMKPHLRNCGKIPTAYCQKCNILIPKSNLELHMKKHEKQNLKPKDFIIVQHFIQNEPLKRKLVPIATPSKKIKIESPKNRVRTPVARKNTKQITVSKIKREPSENSINVSVKKEKEMEKKIKMINRLKFEKKGNKVRMYFCKNCNGCCVKDSYRTLHLSKRCKATRMCERVICQECGLLFNNKTILSHKALHKKRNFTIHDIVFYHIGTLKRIIPSIPKYPQCKDCKITFFCRRLLLDHICGEDYDTCNFCGEKFHNSAYNAHTEFHKLMKTQQPSPKTEAKMMPELIKKYQSLNMMWNIVYSCKKCDIVTDLYDKAVEHSQAHLNQETTSKTIKCYICNLKFDETCWSKHSDLHSRMTINSKDFKILTYEPRKLLTEEWFQLFENLLEEQIRQITDRSLYGYERSVKMMLLKDGRSEFTLYCCSSCKICYHNSEIVKHLKTACKIAANICKICNIPFNDINSLKYHEFLHLKGIKKEEFRVVSFAKVKDEKGHYKRSTDQHVIYKCTNCNSCMTQKTTVPKHKCLTKSRTSKCKKCKQFFHKSFMTKHNQTHKLHPDFNFKNLRIEFFDSLNKNNYDVDPVKTTYKKAGKVKVPAKEPTAAIPRRDTSKTARGDTSKRVKAFTSKTAKANTTKMAIGDTSETATPDTTKTPKTETKTAQVFKCYCGLHYTSIKTIEKHTEICSPDVEISKENCSKCGLLFPTDVLVSHLCKHHSHNTTIIVEAYQKPIEPETSVDSVESTSESPTVQIRRNTANIETDTSPTHNKVKLYKCSECNIYFLTQNTCYKHVSKTHQPVDPRKYIECKLCGLQFTTKSLSVHVSRHHQNELSLYNVLVEEYHPPLGKGPPKIDIYMAAEKVQSRQVTSSIEESRLSIS